VRPSRTRSRLREHARAVGSVVPEPGCRRGCLWAGRLCAQRGLVCAVRRAGRSRGVGARLPTVEGGEWVMHRPGWAAHAPLDRPRPVGPPTPRWTAVTGGYGGPTGEQGSKRATGVQRGNSGPTGRFDGHVHRHPTAHRHPSTYTTGPNAGVTNGGVSYALMLLFRRGATCWPVWIRWRCRSRRVRTRVLPPR